MTNCFFTSSTDTALRCLLINGSGVKHLDAGGARRKQDMARAAYINGAIRYLLWWRTQYTSADSARLRLVCRWAYAGQVVRNLCGYLLFALLRRNPSILSGYIRGVCAGRRFAHSPEGRGLPAF